MDSSVLPQTSHNTSKDTTQLKYWLALLRCPGIGPIRFAALIEHCGSPDAVFDLGQLKSGALKLPPASLDWIKNPNWQAVDEDLAWLEADNNHHIITLADSHYPALLKEIDSPPPLLFVHGNPECLMAPQLGIVGSRNPSAGGKENAHNFAKALAQAGLAITSGLALGIDGIAHQGALSGNGTTIAVTGTGLDRIYPARHKKLGHQIIESGAIISEFPIGTPALADHFPRRNRIISGISLGTLVVEAALRSGSLITARLAAEQGREVFAIPGSIHNPLARGCHALIRQGAKLAETVEHIIEELGPLAHVNLSSTNTTNKPLPDLDANSLKVLKNLGHDPTSIDTLVERSELTPEVVSSILLVLELQGMVSSTPGGLYIRLESQ